MQATASDAELLRQYARSRSEAAFAELVRRHIGLVYGSALRQFHEPNLAEDATQQVFIVLARKAGELASEMVLGAWLLGVAKNESRNLLKRLARRARLERTAGEMMATRRPDGGGPDPAWQALEPLLDDALAELNPGDRRALVLRFFDDKSHREAAEVLGISEATMRQRVFRGVERMRAFFAARGVKVTAAALAEGIAAYAVVTAPPGLAQAATAAAVSAAAGGTAGVLAVWKGTVIAMIKANAAAGVLVAVLLAAGTGMLLYVLMGVREPEPRPVLAGAGPVTTAPAEAQVAPEEPAQPVEPLPPPPDEARGPGWKPGGHPMFVPISALAYDQMRGLRNGNDHLAYINAGSWARYRDVELAEGPSTVVMAIACDRKYAGEVITLHTDAPDGPVIGRLRVKETPGTFEQQDAPVQSKGGRHDVFLTFSGGGFNIRSIKFTGGARDATQVLHASSHSAGHGVIERGTQVMGSGGGDWVRYDRLDFGAGVDAFVIDVIYKPSWDGGAIEARLDGEDGPVIARQEIQGGEAAGFVTATMEAQVQRPVRGVQDVYLTFTGGGRVADINWFRFRRGPVDVNVEAGPPGPATRPEAGPAPGGGIVGWIRRQVPATRPVQ